MSTPKPVPAQLKPLPAAGSPTAVIHNVEYPVPGLIVIHLRPNGDPLGDQKCTFYVKKTTVQADIDAFVTQEKARVVDEYMAAHNAVSNLTLAIGT